MDMSDKKPSEVGATVGERRAVLRRIGFGSFAAVGLLQATSSNAQPVPMKINTIADLQPTMTLQRARLSALGLTKRLPSDTSITNMGLTPEAAKELTPAAAALTKGDLVALQAGRLTPATKGLTVKDLGSIRSAFGNGYRPGGGVVAMDISCCSCTPCCCAAAVNDPLMLKSA